MLLRTRIHFGLINKLFSGLGKLQHIFDINLKRDVFATSVSVPRRVSAARREPLRKKLQRMVKLGVIEKVEHPTDWCSPIVVVPKKNGSIRLCIDYTKLNQAVRREFFPMPSIEKRWLFSVMHGVSRN